MKLRHAAVVLVVLSASQGCLVMKKDFDQCVSDAEGFRAFADQKQKQDAAAIADLNVRLTAAESATQDRDSKLSDLSTASHNLQAQLDEATAINQQLRGELERLGKDADRILADKGTLAKALEDAKSRLDELRKAQAAAEARAQLFKDFEKRFKALIDAHDLSVATRRGQLVVAISGPVLFDPGRTEVRSAGRGVLMELAHALASMTPPGRRYLVTDHVEEPSKKSLHPKSLWELTAARAVSVVEYFVSLGVPPTGLEAAGAGASDPIVPRDSQQNPLVNDRVEIAVLPGDEVPAKP